MADLPRFYEPSLKGTSPGCVLEVNVFELSVGGGGPHSPQEFLTEECDIVDSRVSSLTCVSFPCPKLSHEVKWKSLSRVWLFATPRTIQSMGFSRPVARILEWVAFPSSKGSSQPRDQTQVSLIAGGFFTSWATREAQEYWSGQPFPSPGGLPNPGIETGLLHCRRILYQLSYLGSPSFLIPHTAGNACFPLCFSL